MPPDVPKVKVPSLANDTALVTDDPLPVKATFATVLSTVNDSASTSPESVAVPPTLFNVSALTLLIAPDAVISAPVILSSVDSVRFCEPPVTAPIVMSALLVVVELISIVVALPRVTAPSTMASSDVAMVPFKVTVLPTLAVSYTHLTLPTILLV